MEDKDEHSVPKEHKHIAEEKVRDIKIAYVVVSTSRFKKLMEASIDLNNISGELAEKLIDEAGYTVCLGTIIPDDKELILEQLSEARKMSCDAIIFIGGTGISQSDITIETLEPLLEKKIHGFGELFRYLSYSEVGSSAMLSRAIAGIYGKMLVFAIPGSPNAVKVALEKLIIPEIKHMVYLIKYKDS